MNAFEQGHVQSEFNSTTSANVEIDVLSKEDLDFLSDYIEKPDPEAAEISIIDYLGLILKPLDGLYDNNFWKEILGGMKL